MGGCLKPTEVTLQITTDTCNDAGYQGTNITVIAEEALAHADASSFPPSAQTSNCGADGGIGSLVVVPGPGGNGPILITVATGLNADPIICATASSNTEAGAHCIVEKREITLVDNTPLTLPIDMPKSCAGIICPGACINGRCGKDVVSCSPNGVCTLNGDAGLDAGGGGDARFPVDAPPPSKHDAGHDATINDGGGPTDAGKHDATVPDSGSDTGVDAPPPCKGALQPSGACLETLASNERYPWAIAVQAGRVYWTTECTPDAGGHYLDGGHVREAIDGAVVDLEPGQNAATAMATTDAAVYWTTLGVCTGSAGNPICTGTVAMAPLIGGAPVTVEPAAQRPLGIAASGDTVCWVYNGNDRGAGAAGISGSIWCKTGDAAAVKVSGLEAQPFSGGVAVDRGDVYWTNFGFDTSYDGLMGTVVRGTTQAGAVVTLATAQNYIVNVAASDADVVWMNQVYDASNGTAYGSIHEATSDASDPHVLNGGFGLAFNLAIDDKYVYWAAAAEGKVLKMRRDGTQLTTLASGQLTPSNVVLDGTNGIYWTNNGTCPTSGTPCSGSVMKLSPR
jgi:hypothetical protein